MPQDYGFYGKGIDGYIHYMQAFKESRNGGGGGKPPKGSGCLTSVIFILALLALIALIVY